MECSLPGSSVHGESPFSCCWGRHIPFLYTGLCPRQSELGKDQFFLSPGLPQATQGNSAFILLLQCIRGQRDPQSWQLLTQGWVGVWGRQLCVCYTGKGAVCKHWYWVLVYSQLVYSNLYRLSRTNGLVYFGKDSLVFLIHLPEDNCLKQIGCSHLLIHSFILQTWWITHTQVNKTVLTL